jgi:hypothetical protein
MHFLASPTKSITVPIILVGVHGVFTPTKQTTFADRVNRLMTKRKPVSQSLAMDLCHRYLLTRFAMCDVRTLDGMDTLRDLSIREVLITRNQPPHSKDAYTKPVEKSEMTRRLAATLTRKQRRQLAK